MRPFSPTFEYDLMLRAFGADQPLPKPLQTWLQYGCSKRGSSAYRGPSYFFCVLQDFKKWRDPDSNRGHHDFQSFTESFRYAVNPYKQADFCL
jgi:hypothetical protein